MGYILKNTSGLINTKITDFGRQKISEGRFNVSYFQIGDSEVSYDKVSTSYNFSNSLVLQSNSNAQNSSGVPESNKQFVKYPYYVDGSAGNTYGIPFMDSVPQDVFNRASMRGFFTYDLTSTTVNFSALTNDNYVVSSNYIVQLCNLTGGTTIDLIYSGCNTYNTNTPNIGDIITIFFDNTTVNDCTCYNYPTPTPTASIGSTPTPTPTPTPSNYSSCPPTPTPTPSQTNTCPPPTPSRQCPPVEPPTCLLDTTSCYTMLTYKVVNVCNSTITLDRATPDFSFLSTLCYGRVIIYPKNINYIYDSTTPQYHWNEDVINYESVCGRDEFDVKVWNMNIAWTNNPAGLNPVTHLDYTSFGSVNYIGTKEYLGYNSSSGQTFVDELTQTVTTSDSYYFNSYGEKITVEPEEQKAIAIIHYTNNTIDFFYGEKFALQPYDDTVYDTTGQARNFKLHLPWLMWHKSPSCCSGQTFYVDPPNLQDLNLFNVHYMLSSKNTDMNSPGLRYYHLWDNNLNITGLPNRVGKVFPDLQIIVIDDDELVAAMSYKSNRNWTLPAPKVSLITPNILGTTQTSSDGILTGNTQIMYVTYRFDNTMYTNSLHCNYYSKVYGPNNSCVDIGSQNIAIRFGDEFNCLGTTYSATTNPGCTGSCLMNQGYYAQKLQILCQLVDNGSQPNSSSWKIIDYTNYLSGTTLNGWLTSSGLTSNTFVITKELYEASPTYDLSDYIDITTKNQTGTTLNFGDEYYFYGSLETDIQATIYEMRYKVNLSQTEFLNTSNPTWTKGNKSYVTEIGLFDSNKNLLCISKLQSPILRQGTQQFLVKFDF